MAKVKTQTETGGESVESAKTQAGTQFLTAPTREELFAKVEQAKAGIDPGKKLIAGAAGTTDNGGFIIQIDII